MKKFVIIVGLFILIQTFLLTVSYSNSSYSNIAGRASFALSAICFVVAIVSYNRAKRSIQKLKSKTQYLDNTALKINPDAKGIHDLFVTDRDLTEEANVIKKAFTKALNEDLNSSKDIVVQLEKSLGKLDIPLMQFLSAYSIYDPKFNDDNETNIRNLIHSLGGTIIKGNSDQLDEIINLIQSKLDKK